MFDETLLSQYVDLQTGVDVAKVEADTALTNAQTAGVKAKASAPISVPPSNSLVDPKTHETLYTAPARPSTAAGDKPSRLAELYKKRDLEGLTREETAELEGIEKDKTLVANLYACVPRGRFLHRLDNLINLLAALVEVLNLPIEFRRGHRIQPVDVVEQAG